MKKIFVLFIILTVLSCATTGKIIDEEVTKEESVEVSKTIVYTESGKVSSTVETKKTVVSQETEKTVIVPPPPEKENSFFNGWTITGTILSICVLIFLFGKFMIKPPIF